MLLTAMLCIISLVACQNISQDTYLKLELYDETGLLIDTQNILENELPVKPNEDPIKAGFIFIDWFTSVDGGTTFDFTKPLSHDTKIYARWRLEIGYALNYQYSIHSNFDLVLFEIHEDSIILTDEASIQINDQTIILPKEVLSTYEIGSYLLEFRVDSELIQVHLNIFDGTKPYVINTDALKYEQDKDVVLMLEMFGQTFLSLAHNQMTHDDYIYLDSVLTVKSTYLSNILTDATSAIMVMQYKLDNHYSSIYITIKA